MALADEQGLRVNTPRAPHRRGNTVCLDFEGSEDACRRLIDMGFVVDWRPHGGIRISPHFYNSDDECQDIMTAARVRHAVRLPRGPPGSLRPSGEVARQCLC